MKTPRKDNSRKRPISQLEMNLTISSYAVNTKVQQKNGLSEKKRYYSFVLSLDDRVYYKVAKPLPFIELRIQDFSN